MATHCCHGNIVKAAPLHKGNLLIINEKTGSSPKHQLSSNPHESPQSQLILSFHGRLKEHRLTERGKFDE
jgi:hypothetical protein